MDVPLGEGGLHLVALVLAHQAVVHEHAGELAAHRLGQQGGGHGGIHAAGQGQQHLAAAHLLPDGLDGALLVVAHGPVALGAADLIEEVADHVHAVLGVIDLRVVLHPVEAPLLVGNGHVGAGVGVGGEGEALGHLGHVVPVAHPGDAPLRQAFEELAGGVVIGLGLAVLPGGVLVGLGHLAAQGVGHELAAIADAQHRHAQLKDGRVGLGRARLIDGVGAAGEDEADGLHSAEFLQRGRVGLDLAIDAALAHPAGDELVVLAAEIQDNHGLMGHHLAFFLSFSLTPCP